MLRDSSPAFRKGSAVLHRCRWSSAHNSDFPRASKVSGIVAEPRFRRDSSPSSTGPRIDRRLRLDCWAHGPGIRPSIAGASQLLLA
ncbi:unnamed protein product [Heligmosomoides polygyrus]|uniref:Uncharacterized protein n=1 Tax=Heligmosomoides polygyrus TaxID=6339 RepID=A0A183FK70_HELPZ|nr:unnamed protein product [Heligmosomoides polygyrus]